LLGAGTVDILDTSNPDTLTAYDFHNVNVVASSKSGGAIETICALAWGLDNGIEIRDLSIVTDPGSQLEGLRPLVGCDHSLRRPSHGCVASAH
jgi:hypothetical protein